MNVQGSKFGAKIYKFCGIFFKKVELHKVHGVRFFQVSLSTYQTSWSLVAGVTCHMSCVTCPLSLKPTATSTDPSPANSPIMHSRLVCKDLTTKQKIQKSKKIITTKKTVRYANNTDTLFDQMSSVHQEAGFPGDSRTLQLRNLEKILKSCQKLGC